MKNVLKAINRASALSTISHELSAESLLRIVLAIVFIVSGAAKMWDIYGFCEIVGSYGVLPESLNVAVSVLIPFTEILFGGMLISNLHSQTARLSLLIMVGVFTALSAMKYSSGAQRDCGCFGEIIERKTGVGLFAENAALIIALSILRTKRKM